MERLFAGKVYEMVAQPNGIVFSYCKENLDNKARVRYQMISFDTKTVTEVAKNIYQLSKFGSNYRAVASLCSNYVSARALVLPTGRVFMIEDNGRAVLFDDEGKLFSLIVNLLERRTCVAIFAFAHIVVYDRYEKPYLTFAAFA